ncbi:filamentous hemagglutinin N-terminal domain-containing protein, partial [Marimonas sp. MJW-29]
MADTLPTGGTVVHGSAQISTPSAATMMINQGSDRAVVNWDGFSIGQGARVDINQPGADAAILNRVTGDTTSQIHGQLNANGRVFVVNPNGIFIGPTGRVNAGSFVASTLNMRDDDFVTGKTVFEGNGASAAVENVGNVQVVTGGYAALIGGKVKNSGAIQAPLGFVGLGAGERVTLDLSGDGFLQVTVPSDTDDDGLEALIENSGTIQANGGIVQISAATARNAARHAINMSGVVEATTVSGRNGRITLGGGSGGKVTVSGHVRTSTRPTIEVTESIRPALRPERGGDITITGRDITLAGAALDASGENGGGDIRVGGEFQGGPGLPAAETLSVDGATTINADGISAGDGGRIILWSELETTFAGNISARGGASEGNGGFVEVSGKQYLSYRGLTDVRAPNGSVGELLLDPSDVEIVGAAPGVNQILNTDLVTQLELGDVIVATDGSGDLPDPFTDFGLSEPGTITVDAPVAWASGTLLTLDADGDVVVNQPITALNGDLEINAGSNILLNQAISLPNGEFHLATDDDSGEISTGPAGTVDVDLFRLSLGNWMQILNPLPSFSANNFVVDTDTYPFSPPTFLRALSGDGSTATPYLLSDIYGLQGVGTHPFESYALNNNIDASSTKTWQSLVPVPEQYEEGFVPLDFYGALDGNRHTISNLFINRYSASSSFVVAGMFNNLSSSASIVELNIADADVSGLEAGILAASNNGIVRGVSTSGTVRVYNNWFFTGVGGGIVAVNDDNEGGFGRITGSQADVTVTDIEDPFGEPDEPSDYVFLGGIVGLNYGSVQEVRSGGLISYDHAIHGDAGGIVGLNYGDTRNAYSTASVAADTNSAAEFISDSEGVFDFAGNAGGIVGHNLGLIENVIANGPVNLIGTPGSGGAGAVTGSEVYVEDFGNMMSSFFNPETTGQTDSGQLGEVDLGGGPFQGARSRTTAQLNDAVGFFAEASSAGWDFFSTWAIPQDAIDHARLYTVDPVISADDAVSPNSPFDYSVSNANFEYSSSTTGYSAVNGQYFGGPDVYLFGPRGDTGDLSTMDDQIILSDPNVGGITYRFPTDYTSDRGQSYDVRSVPIPGNVTPAPLTITLDNIDKVYGTDLTSTPFGFTAETLFGTDTVDSVSVLSPGSFPNAPVSEGAYPVWAENIIGSNLGNYVINIVPGSLRVLPRTLNVEIDDAEKTYGDEIVFNGTEFTALGLINGDTLATLSISSAGQPASAPVDDSPYLIIAEGPVGTGLGNYVINIVPGSLRVLPRTLNVEIDDAEKTYGDEIV